MIKEKEFEASIEKLEDVLNFVNECIGDCDKTAKRKVTIAVEEIFMNIANYAYLKSQGKVRLSCSIKKNCLSVTFCDQGIPFNPLEKSDPDTTLSADERPIGGLGIFIVKKYMDQMFYNYVNGENRLTLIKNLN